MSIDFKFCKEDGYVIFMYNERFNNTELLAAWKNLYENSDWSPGLNELIDCSRVNGTDVTNDGLRSLAKYTKSIFSKYSIRSKKVAIYAPKDLSFGMSRMYQAMSDDTIETVRVFKSMQEAMSWIKEKEEIK